MGPLEPHGPTAIPLDSNSTVESLYPFPMESLVYSITKFPASSHDLFLRCGLTIHPASLPASWYQG